MQSEMDTIQFESKTELQELIRVIDNYMEQNPGESRNDILNRFYDLLEVMEMSW